MKNFENCNVQELNQKEACELGGGGILGFIGGVVLAVLIYKAIKDKTPPPPGKYPNTSSGAGAGGLEDNIKIY